MLVVLQNKWTVGTDNNQFVNHQICSSHTLEQLSEAVAAQAEKWNIMPWDVAVMFPLKGVAELARKEGKL